MTLHVLRRKRVSVGPSHSYWKSPTTPSLPSMPQQFIISMRVLLMLTKMILDIFPMICCRRARRMRWRMKNSWNFSIRTTLWKRMTGSIDAMMNSWSTNKATTLWGGLTGSAATKLTSMKQMQIMQTLLRVLMTGNIPMTHFFLWRTKFWSGKIYCIEY